MKVTIRDSQILKTEQATLSTVLKNKVWVSRFTLPNGQTCDRTPVLITVIQLSSEGANERVLLA